MKEEEKYKINCNPELCSYITVTDKTHPILRLLPGIPYGNLFVCLNHTHLHLCQSKSHECVLEKVDMSGNRKCRFTDIFHPCTTLQNIDVHSLRKKINMKKKKWTLCGKHGKSIRDLIANDVNVREQGIPNAYEYYIIILEDMTKNGLTIDHICNSAIHRTYTFFIENSTQSMWQEHLGIIQSCFRELFSKSNTPCDDFGSSDFKTRIKFIISMEMMGKIKLAGPLYLQEKYVTKRQHRFKVWTQNNKKIRFNSNNGKP
jgi:hypothetical protein